MIKQHLQAIAAIPVHTPAAEAEAQPVVDPCWCEQSAADYYGVSVRWMQRAREKGTGPRYCRLGGLVRYRRSWLDQFAESNTGTSIAEHRERSNSTHRSA